MPPISKDQVVARDHGCLPGGSSWLLIKLYGHRDRQPEIVAEHLPDLLADWARSPDWWFTRYHDPESHLRLRVAVTHRNDVGSIVQNVAGWAERLRGRGLLRDLQLATSYPETGRWGRGDLLAAAEEVFVADSRAVAVQFSQHRGPSRQVLVAANLIAIAAAFLGSTQAGMRWLIAHARITSSVGLDRVALGDAQRLANPDEDWAALRSVPGGAAIVDAWPQRAHALARYRARLAQTEQLDPDVVLDSLLHAHHIRAAGIDKDDERICLRLARAAALSWCARTARSGT